ncbi:patatin-like phospholipase family protein [Rhodoferax sp. TS-BS-61-7]|uniref:patatin-like phospholipase family protein n=1 Tax=Rhodoferax sp. TS-BS-61-7 TaxID=2094194 RepID=UPI000CF73629|nr:patatin-like phospholipase family protein [Rhodoferax sp. TS-BS-61-7]PQA78350.1 phospholipase [Rhodoferax sp. TS-BS-61-7]
MQALHIYAGPKARAALAANGLQPEHIRTIPGAAGGPKGLILGALDRFIFGDWLTRSQQPVDLVGASIGAWRMASACLNDPAAAFARLEHDYIHQHYELAPGQKRVSAEQISETFGHNLQAFYGGRVPEVLQHPRYRLHIVTSRGRHMLRTEHGLRTPLGYLGAFLTNTVHRKAMGAWLERVVFSSPHAVPGAACAPLPFATGDYRTRQVALSEANFNPALQASCSIPFVLKAIHNIPGAPHGAYWDGGITDYHLHLNYPGAAGATKTGAARADSTRAGGTFDTKGLVLYPHFQKSVVPGWLDKGLKWRHGSTTFLDTMVLLAPNPEWVKTLPNSKLPDRTDFTHYGNDLAARVKAWTAATRASQQMVDEFIAWLHKPDMNLVRPL